MSQIERKWIANQAINNEKVDHTDTYDIQGLRVDSSGAPPIGGIGIGISNYLDPIHIRRTDTSAAIRLDLDDGIFGRSYQIASNSDGFLAIKDINANATRAFLDSDGSLHFTDDILVGRNLYVGTDATIGRNLEIVGDLTVDDINLDEVNINDATVARTLTVNRTSLFRDATTSSGLYVGTDATIGGNMHVVGDMHIDDIIMDELNINDATVARTLTVEGTVRSDLLPSASNTYDLGAGNKWRDMRCINAYATYASITSVTVTDATIGGNSINSGNILFDPNNIANITHQNRATTSFDLTIQASNCTGVTASLNGGDALLKAGNTDSTFGSGGTVIITAGSSTGSSGLGGNVEINAGTGAGGNGNITLTSDLVSIGTDISIGRDTIVTNDLNIGGDASVAGYLTASDDIVGDADLSIGGYTRLEKNTTIVEDLYIQQRLEVTQDTTIGEDLHAQRDVFVTRDLTVGRMAQFNDAYFLDNTGYIPTLNVSQDATVSGTIVIGGDVSCIGSIYGSSLNVSGGANADSGYFTGDVDIVGSLDVTDEFHTSADATVVGNLYVQSFNDTTYSPVITGFSSYSTNQTHYKKLGHDAILLLWNITGISDTTTGTEFKFDLPFTAKTSGYEWTVACGYS